MEQPALSLTVSPKISVEGFQSSNLDLPTVRQGIQVVSLVGYLIGQLSETSHFVS
jgi:hypothetical protein